MEFALDEIPSLLNGPLNDEDLYALCEKICIAVLELSQDAASKAVITRESVMLLPQGKIAIDIDLHRQNIPKDDLLANHVYSIGSVLLWLSKTNSQSRQREEMLDNLINEMMNTLPQERPTLEIVSEACKMILQQYQVMADEILNIIHTDCSDSPNAETVIGNRKKQNTKVPQIKPRTRSPYQLVSIEDREGELRDGSLLVDDDRAMDEKNVDDDHMEITETSSEDMGSILNEEDIDVAVANTNDDNWDYQHLDMALYNHESEELQDTKVELIQHANTIHIDKEHPLGNFIQTHEDKEVQKITEDHKRHLPEANKSIDEDRCSKSKKQDNQTFKSLIHDNDIVMKKDELQFTVGKDTVNLSSHEFQSSACCESNKTRHQNFNNNQLLFDPSIESSVRSNSTLKASELWRSAGMKIKSRLNIPSNKGIIGVIRQAEAQGRLKPSIFNRNITKAINAMTKTKDNDQFKGPKEGTDEDFSTTGEISFDYSPSVENDLSQKKATEINKPKQSLLKNQDNNVNKISFSKNTVSQSPSTQQNVSLKNSSQALQKNSFKTNTNSPVTKKLTANKIMSAASPVKKDVSTDKKTSNKTTSSISSRKKVMSTKPSATKNVPVSSSVNQITKKSSKQSKTSQSPSVNKKKMYASSENVNRDPQDVSSSSSTIVKRKLQTNSQNKATINNLSPASQKKATTDKSYPQEKQKTTKILLAQEKQFTSPSNSRKNQFNKSPSSVHRKMPLINKSIPVQRPSEKPKTHEKNGEQRRGPVKNASVPVQKRPQLLQKDPPLPLTQKKLNATSLTTINKQKTSTSEKTVKSLPTNRKKSNSVSLTEKKQAETKSSKNGQLPKPKRKIFTSKAPVPGKNPLKINSKSLEGKSNTSKGIFQKSMPKTISVTEGLNTDNATLPHQSDEIQSSNNEHDKKDIIFLSVSDKTSVNQNITCSEVNSLEVIRKDSPSQLKDDRVQIYNDSISSEEFNVTSTPATVLPLHNKSTEANALNDKQNVNELVDRELEQEKIIIDLINADSWSLKTESLFKQSDEMSIFIKEDLHSKTKFEDIYENYECVKDYKGRAEEKLQEVLSEPLLEPAILPDISIQETGKLKSKPSSKYRQMKFSGKKRRQEISDLGDEPEKENETNPENPSVHTLGNLEKVPSKDLAVYEKQQCLKIEAVYDQQSDCIKTNDVNKSNQRIHVGLNPKRNEDEFNILSNDAELTEDNANICIEKILDAHVYPGVDVAAVTFKPIPTNKMFLGTESQNQHTEVALEDIMSVLNLPLHEETIWLLLQNILTALLNSKYNLLSPASIIVNNMGLINLCTKQGTESNNSEINERDLVFSIGACLWYCADFSLSEDESPALGTELQDLLISMTDPTQNISINRLREVCKGREEQTLKPLFKQYLTALNGDKITQCTHPIAATQEPATVPSIQIIINKEETHDNHIMLEQTVTFSEVGSINLHDQYDGKTRSVTKKLVDLSLDDLLKQDIKTASTKVGNHCLEREIERSVELTIGSEVEGEDSHVVDFVSAEDLNDELTETKRRPCQESSRDTITSLSTLTVPPLSQISSLLASCKCEVRSPNGKAFVDLSDGLNCLKSQISKLYLNDVAKNESAPDQNFGTPKTSSPINSSDQDLEDYSISPIKYSSPEKTNSPDIDQTESLFTAIQTDFTGTDSARDDYGDKLTGPVSRQLSRRNSIIETLNILKSEGKIPEEGNEALNDIMELLNLDIDITDVLDHLENRIELNLDRLDKGDTVANALAGVESDIEFKLLQVAAMKRAADNTGDITSETTNSASRLKNTLDLIPGYISDDDESYKIKDYSTELSVINSDSQSNIKELNREIMGRLREISKSPLHYEDLERETQTRSLELVDDSWTGENMNANDFISLVSISKQENDIQSHAFF